MEIDLLHPDAGEEARKHKLKRLVQAPNSYFLDIKCPGCERVFTVFSHAQTVIKCHEYINLSPSSCDKILCRPTGGKCKLETGVGFRKKPL